MAGGGSLALTQGSYVSLFETAPVTQTVAQLVFDGTRATIPRLHAQLGGGTLDANGQIVNLAALRHLARPYVVAAPAGVHAGRGDGVTGRLILKVTASHADQPVEIGWSALTLSSPIAKGTCLNTSAWDAASARLTLGLDSGAGCQITISVS